MTGVPHKQQQKRKARLHENSFAAGAPSSSFRYHTLSVHNTDKVREALPPCAFP